MFYNCATEYLVLSYSLNLLDFIDKIHDNKSVSTATEIEYTTEHEWTAFDRFLRFLRLQKVARYIKTNGVLCDLGCGQDAYLLRYFSSRIRQGIGFDGLVTDDAWQNISIKRASLLDRIPLSSESVDTVTILAALEHFTDDRNILVEAHRVLKKGGVVLITVPTLSNKPLLELLARVGVINRAEILDHKRYYEKKDIQEILRAAGFEAPRVRYWQCGLNLFARAHK